MTVEQPGQGLEMFFDQSDATRFRQVRFGGYDKADVDQFLVETERRVQAQQQRILRLEAQLAEAQQNEQTVPLPEPGGEHDIGHRAQVILQMAEEEGRQRKEVAAGEAEQTLLEARRQARGVLEQAERDAEDVRLTTQAHADTLRARLERETGDVVARAGSEAAELLARSREQSALLEQEAATLAERTREAALRDADVTRQEALTEAAQWRLEAEQTRSELLSTLRAEHEEAQGVLEASMAERVETTERANRELADMVAEANRVRNAAVAEADEIRSRMLRETEQQITVARQQAQVSLDRSTERHNLAIGSLRREIASLQQNRQSIVDQLSNLSAMVTATAGQFSDADLDLDESPAPAALTADDPTAELPVTATTVEDVPGGSARGGDAATEPETLDLGTVDEVVGPDPVAGAVTEDEPTTVLGMPVEDETTADGTAEDGTAEDGRTDALGGAVADGATGLSTASAGDDRRREGSGPSSGPDTPSAPGPAEAGADGDDHPVVEETGRGGGRHDNRPHRPSPAGRPATGGPSTSRAPGTGRPASSRPGR